VDVVGYFTGPSASSARAGLFLPVIPTRQFDTRDGNGRRLAAGSSVNLRYDQQPLALLGNLTITNGGDAGFATAGPADAPSVTTSSVNTTRAGQSIAAGVAVAHAAGTGVKFTNVRPAAHLIFDLTGVYVTDAGDFGSPTPSSVEIGPREDVSPFGDLAFTDLLARFPGANSTRAAVMTSDGAIHSFGQQDVSLPAASTIKSLVLGCTLTRFQDHGLAVLDAQTAGLVQRMISVSDNDATTSLVDKLGGLPALKACGSRFGATAITLSPNGWGVTQIPPESLVAILRNLLRPDSTVLDSNWIAQARTYMLSSNIAQGERWGVGAGLPSDATYWVKDGWWTTVPGDFRYPGTRINSVGMVEEGSKWWITAIQGDRYASQAEGIAATELIASTVNNNLERPNWPAS
jgi:hypothetical protein